MQAGKTQNEAAQPFFPFPRFAARTREQAILEIEQPCFLYRTPLSFEERMKLLFSKQLSAATDVLAPVSNVLAGGTPLNWHMLLHYLCSEKIIETPYFTVNNTRNDLPKTYQLGLRVLHDAENTSGTDVSPNGYASSPSPDIAMSKAVGESLERYFLTRYSQAELLHASYASLKRFKTRILPIERLNSYLPWQKELYPRFSYDDEKALYWCAGETLDGGPAYIPAQLVYWNYNLDADQREPILAQSTTNGAGAYFSKEGAILAGWLEAIQRDGFLLYWLNGIAPRRIDLSSIEDEEIRALLDSLDRYGITPHVLDTTSDIGIPSVTCVLLDERTEEPIIGIGGGTGFNLKDTILHGLSEALVVLNQIESWDAFTLPTPYAPFRDRSIGRQQRLSLWRGAEMRKRFSFFLEGASMSAQDIVENTAHVQDEHTQFEYVGAQFEKKGEGYETYLYEAKHPVLSKLRYHVAKVIVPQLLPLYLNENMASLDSKRLREFSEKIGLRAPKELTLWPHPFP